MKCHVYRSSARDGLYVFVAAPTGDGVPADAGAPGDANRSDSAVPAAVAALPEPVRRQLGRPELAMTLDLVPGMTLGQERVDDVLANLAERGFHVQMPRDIEHLVEGIANEGTDAPKA